jgi:hypothetical protein
VTRGYKDVNVADAHPRLFLLFFPTHSLSLFPTCRRWQSHASVAPLPNLLVKLFPQCILPLLPFYFENTPLIWLRIEEYPSTMGYVDFV